MDALQHLVVKSDRNNKLKESEFMSSAAKLKLNFSDNLKHRNAHCAQMILNKRKTMNQGSVAASCYKISQ